MEAKYLIGKTIAEISAYPPQAIHSAWRNEPTPHVYTYMAFLKLEGGELIGISPCEVTLEGERYPALGLSLERCRDDSIRLHQPDGRVIYAVPLSEAAFMLPFEVRNVVESDPLGEGAVSQLRIEGVGSRAITLRHIMPPITLGIILE